MTDTKLTELLRMSMVDLNKSEQISQEIIAILDEKSKKKLYDLLALKARAILRIQKEKFEELIFRYSEEKE